MRPPATTTFQRSSSRPSPVPDTPKPLRVQRAVEYPALRAVKRGRPAGLDLSKNAAAARYRSRSTCCWGTDGWASSHWKRPRQSVNSKSASR
ncbi:MAG: hypothetical protein M3083_14100 [Actinomycetota bacterium]|nr:hypothetical protein [Actinomycetota bacterium]